MSWLVLVIAAIVLVTRDGVLAQCRKWGTAPQLERVEDALKRLPDFLKIMTVLRETL